MHLKGLVKFFTAMLILISLYQLSLTFIVRNEEKRMRAQALRAAKAENPVSVLSTKALIFFLSNTFIF